jgi:peptidoglycan/xylan/chitin deacetylase (PgdA/CDA1 family)
MSSIRLDRECCVRVAHPLQRLLWSARTSAIPILMYHGIRESAGSDHPYYELHTSPAVFESHLHYLHREGYTTVDLDEALDIVSTRRNVRKTVAITFDDGYLDFYSHALPILLEFGFTATVFVIPEFVRSANPADEHRAYMSWAEIREIHEAGIRIGSHSMSHADLQQLTPREVDRELGLSRLTIEDKLGCEVRSFSYPYSFPEHNRSFVQQMHECLQVRGYRHAVSTILGSANESSDRFHLPRLPINAHDDLLFLAAKLEGAYDWMHVAQSTRKLFMQITRSKPQHTVPITTS